MTKKKILVVDDEPELCRLLQMSLEDAGYEVHTAQNAAEMTAEIERDKPDLIVLDVMLPDVSGVKLTGQLKNRPETASIPVILLTAKDSETDILVGFNMGADDYVTKPFSTAVLVARIEAVLRRHTREAVEQPVVVAGPIRVLTASRQVFVGQESIELTPAEFAILACLVKAKGAVVSRQQLVQRIGSENVRSAERIINVHVSALRKKLGPARKYIKTVHGAGYRVEVPSKSQ
jgi:DNA-binding response OmpR family regulator